MERPAHVAPDDTRGPALLAELAGALDRRHVARDDDLSGRVEVRWNHRPDIARVGARRRDLLGGESQDGRHRAGTLPTGFEHELSASMHEANGVLEGERSRRHTRGVFTETVPRAPARPNPLGFEQAQGGDAVSEQSRLSVARLAKPVLRTVPADVRDREAERMIGRVEHRASLGESL